MSKKQQATFPGAGNDFYKTNGVDASFSTDGPSLTRQEFAAEADINTIMKQYEGYNTGPGNLPNQRDPAAMFYADFTALPKSLMDYHAMMDTAQTAFMTLPAEVRREFNNSPVEFYEFASDPENIGQLRTWGLAAPEKVPEPPMKVEIVAGGDQVKPAAAPGGAATHGST